jgi:hypothetical protein
MPHLTLPVTDEGLTLHVMVGLPGPIVAALVAAWKPVPPALLLDGVVDPGSNTTCVAQRVIQHFHLQSAQRTTTHTAIGPAQVNVFNVSLSIPAQGALLQALVVIDQILVMELTKPPPGIEVLVGLDALKHMLLFLDAGRGEFTLTD